MSLATVDPITSTAQWGSKAAAGDALSRSVNDKPFVAIFVKEDGSFGYSKANTDFASLSMMAMYLLEMAHSCIRGKL